MRTFIVTLIVIASTIWLLSGATTSLVPAMQRRTIILNDIN